MARGIGNNETGVQPVNDLEPYRRLVELQKEITELAQQNDHARQKCEELRDHVATDVLSQRSTRPRAGLYGMFAQLPLGLFVSSALSRILKQT